MWNLCDGREPKVDFLAGVARCCRICSVSEFVSPPMSFLDADPDRVRLTRRCHLLWKRRLSFCSFLRSALASDMASASECPVNCPLAGYNILLFDSSGPKR